jgi:hypothetical protein
MERTCAQFGCFGPLPPKRIDRYCTICRKLYMRDRRDRERQERVKAQRHRGTHGTSADAGKVLTPAASAILDMGAFL